MMTLHVLSHVVAVDKDGICASNKCNMPQGCPGGATKGGGMGEEACWADVEVACLGV